MKDIENNKIAHKKEMRQKNNKLCYQRHKEYFKKKYDNMECKLYCECCDLYFTTNFNQQKHNKTLKHVKNILAKEKLN